MLAETESMYYDAKQKTAQVLYNLSNMRAQVNTLEVMKATHLTDIATNEYLIDLYNVTNVVLGNASKTIRDVARGHFEKIITDALQFVTQDNTIKFVIEESVTRNKPSYEFYIETMVDGNVSRQKPEEACGGGFIDIISVTAKYAYWQIFKDPEIKNSSSILDEPGKMISEQMSVKFAEYIKFLGKHFNKQTIMITHNENLANIADKMFYVSKNRNGISQVSLSMVLDTEAENVIKSAIDPATNQDWSEEHE
jgi:DNA repair exonuclease SbcCD ATPase subunit